MGRFPTSASECPVSGGELAAQAKWLGQGKLAEPGLLHYLIGLSQKRPFLREARKRQLQVGQNGGFQGPNAKTWNGKTLLHNQMPAHRLCDGFCNGDPQAMKIDRAWASTAGRSPDHHIDALKAACTRRGAERALSVDTTAAGGNTPRMSMQDELVG